MDPNEAIGGGREEVLDGKKLFTIKVVIIAFQLILVDIYVGEYSILRVSDIANCFTEA